VVEVEYVEDFVEELVDESEYVEESTDGGIDEGVRARG